MTLDPSLRVQLRRLLSRYEGRVNHMYLDTRGNATIGVGHLIVNAAAARSLPLHVTSGNVVGRSATAAEKAAEYEAVAARPWGPRYRAAAYKPFTTLVMPEPAIDALLDRHIDTFHRELRATFNRANGGKRNFDELPLDARLALFDMVFNLGMTRLRASFPNFCQAILEEDWSRAAAESVRRDVSPTRNTYVRELLHAMETAE